MLSVGFKRSLTFPSISFGQHGFKTLIKKCIDQPRCAADVTTWAPTQTYDVWHDRAALHFLTDPKDRAAYAGRVLRAVRPGGHVIIGTFALDGPERCSGLPVVRHDAASLGQLLGPSFEFVESKRHDHHTPAGFIQRFQFSRFRRLN